MRRTRGSSCPCSCRRRVSLRYAVRAYKAAPASRSHRKRRMHLGRGEQCSSAAAPQQSKAKSRPAPRTMVRWAGRAVRASIASCGASMNGSRQAEAGRACARNSRLGRRRRGEKGKNTKRTQFRITRCRTTKHGGQYRGSPPIEAPGQAARRHRVGHPGETRPLHFGRPATILSADRNVATRGAHPLGGGKTRAPERDFIS